VLHGSGSRKAAEAVAWYSETANIAFATAVLMSIPVHRFIVRACPSANHPKFFAWQTALICVFVGDANSESAFTKAQNAIQKEEWLPIGAFRKDTLIERIVFDQGEEEVVAAYKEAQGGKAVLRARTDQMPMATKGRLPFMKAPRIGELFLDRVVHRAGGRRLTSDEADAQHSRNADYIVGDSVIELKDIQEEGLLVPGRQDRLAQLFGSLGRGGEYASLSPEDLSDIEWRQYMDILARPIQNQVKSAAKQIKASRNHLGKSKGGVIFLNTGYSSIPHNLFDSLVKRYCEKDTQQVDFSICISSWLLTNGFESEVFFSFSPKEGECELVMSLRNAFWLEIDLLMDSWAQEGFSQDGDLLQPMIPIAFRANSMNYSFNPPVLSSELDDGWKEVCE